MEENTPSTCNMKTPKRLPLVRRYTYGVGHVLNDLCASMWFSYLLLYFHKVLSFTSSMAGGVLLLGQIVDGFCTPLIGYESDRTKSGVCNYGRRKSWHLVGTLCVLCSFVFIFQPVLGGQTSEDWARFIYYAPLVVIFQFGWAATQISHLSLIPELSSDDGERVELNAIRYAFTVMASIFVYLVTYLLLRLQSDPDDQGSSNVTMDSSSLDPDDVSEFRYLVFIVIGTGAVFSAIFHFGTKEPAGGQRRTANEIEDSSNYGSIQASNVPKLKMSWKDWFKEPQFYQITALYMFTRLMVNIAQIYIPMYVTDSLLLTKDSVALVPLVVYISGFAATFVAKPLNKYLGRKLTYFVGAVVYLAACVWMAFPDIGLEGYGAAILLGAGGSTVLVTSLSLTADLIGHNTETGAFVYGAMSLTDKFSNGIAVEIIQLMQPCIHCCPACKWYYQVVLTYVTGGAAIGAVAVLATLAPVTIGKRRKRCTVGLDICHDDDLVSGKPEDGSQSCDDDADATLSQPNGYQPQTNKQPHKELRICTEAHAHSDNIPHKNPGDDTTGASMNHKPNNSEEQNQELKTSAGFSPSADLSETTGQVARDLRPCEVVSSLQGDPSCEDSEKSSVQSQNLVHAHVDQSGIINPTSSSDNPI